MKRTTIMLSDELDQRLRLEARRRGLSIAEIVRQAVEGILAKDHPAPLSFVAIGEGGPPDASEQVDEIVMSAMRRRRERNS